MPLHCLIGQNLLKYKHHYMCQPVPLAHLLALLFWHRRDLAHPRTLMQTEFCDNRLFTKQMCKKSTYLNRNQPSCKRDITIAVGSHQQAKSKHRCQSMKCKIPRWKATRDCVQVSCVKHVCIISDNVHHRLAARRRAHTDATVIYAKTQYTCKDTSRLLLGITIPLESPMHG